MPPPDLKERGNSHTEELSICFTRIRVHHQLYGQKPPIKQATTHRTYIQYAISTLIRASFITLSQSTFKER